MEIRCKKCNAKLGNLLNLVDKLLNNNKVVLEIKCRRCKKLNNFFLFSDFLNKKDII